MPHLTIKLDVDERGFDALSGMGTAADGIAAGRVIHLGDDANIEVGTLRAGMQSGKDSVALCFALPDGKVVLAETSAELFLATARAISGWQEGRRERGEG
jgi:hypothetical protein